MHALVLWPVNANCPGFRGGIPEKKVSGFLTNTGTSLIANTKEHPKNKKVEKVGTLVRALIGGWLGSDSDRGWACLNSILMKTHGMEGIGTQDSFDSHRKEGNIPENGTEVCTKTRFLQMRYWLLAFVSLF